MNEKDARAVDILVALAAALGIAFAGWSIADSLKAMREAGEYADGLEGLGLLLGIPALMFFVPALLCTGVAMRNDSESLRNTGRALVLTGYCGGPVLLFLLFAVVTG